MRRVGVAYGVGLLLTLVGASLAACSADEEASPGGAAAGKGGEGMGGDGTTAEAGSKTGGEGGGGAGGGGGAAGGVAELGGYRVLKRFDEIGADKIVAWPEQKRVAVMDLAGQGIEVFDVNATEAGIQHTETLRPKDLLDDAGGISQLAQYGDDLVAVVSREGQPVRSTLVKVHGIEAEPLLDVPEGEYVGALVAEPAIGIAIQTRSGLLFAKGGASTWTTLADGNRLRPLALEGDKILVGVEELDRFELEGAAGAGGQGGAGGSDASAHVRWLDLSGKELVDFVALGNPEVAVKDEAGWLIGETNSFWGSYEAGIELLSDAGLRTLTQVPVVSAGDGVDGAYDLVHVGDRLLVANCESGLLSSPFSSSKLTLLPVDGPWNHDSGRCAPTAIETVGNTLVVGGKPLVFLLAP